MIAAYVPDLMDRSKVAAAAPGTTFVTSPRELVSVEADVVVLDLTRPGVLEALPEIRAHTIGFCRHTMRDVIAAAAEAGCDEVLVRSEFFARLPEVLGAS